MILSLLHGCVISHDEQNVDEVHNNIAIETFVPKELSMRWDNLFAFVSDSVGYAATNDLCSDKCIISKTIDRGRTWERIDSASGKCIVLKVSGDNVCYSSERTIENGDSESEIGFIKHGRRKVLLSKLKGRVYSMNMFNDSTLVYVQDVRSQKEYRGIDEISDSIYLSTDTGKTWKVLFADMKNINVIGYDSLDVYLTAYLDNPRNYYWVVSDINTGDRRIYDRGRHVFKAFVDDGILVRDVRFFKYDDNMKYISAYPWNGDRGYGHYIVWYFAKNGETALAYASQFPGKENREECIFYSTNSGYNWKAISIGHGLMHSGLFQSSAAKIPTEIGLSVIYQDYSDSLRIINICPNAEGPEYTLKETLTSSIWAVRNEKGEIDNRIGRPHYSFTSDTLCISFVGLGKEWEVKKQYYLSSAPDQVFNKSKVGMSDAGPYIIVEDRENKLFVIKVNSFSRERIDYEYDYRNDNRGQVIDYHKEDYVLSIQ